MPTPTYTVIATTEVGALGSSSITFSSIPQTYTDLIIQCSLRDNLGSQVNNNVVVSLNGSSANGTSRELFGAGGSAGSAALTNVRVDYHNASTATSNTFGSAEVYIPNYTGSTNKVLSSTGVAEDNTSNGPFMAINGNLWSQTAAITSITLTPGSSAAFVQYSKATIYGIKNS
jgi:hypothetical protein